MDKEIKKELQEMNSFLAKEKIEDGYDVPANYFNNLQLDLIQKLDIKNEDIAETKSTSFLSRLKESFLSPRPLLGMATAALFALGLFFWLQPNDTNTQLALNDLSNEEIQEYIAYNIDDFDVDLISTISTTAHTDIFSNEFEDGQIDEYLENNLDEFDDQLFDELF